MLRRLLGKQRGHDPGDLEVIANLIKYGADLRLPRDTVHFLYFPTRVAAEQAAPQLRSLGLAVQIEHGVSGTNWLLRANRDMIVNAETITIERLALERICKAYGGNYDGWEAAV